MSAVVELEKEQNEKPQEKKDAHNMSIWKARVEVIFEHMYFVILMSVLTLWALFNDDIRFAGTFKNADPGFDVVISIAFFLFLIEIFASSFYKGQEYLYLPDWAPIPGETIFQTWTRRAMFGSFYFWLDWIATLSLILEVCAL